MLPLLTIVDASAHSCPTSSTAIAIGSVPATNRVQKSRNRKSLSNITPTNIERGLNGDLAALELDAQPECTSKAASGNTTPNNVSHESSTSSSPQTKRHVAEGRDGSTLQFEGEMKKEKEQPQLRLGMMGIGGYGASPDEIGWAGEWSDPWEPEAAEQQEQMVQESSYRGTNGNAVERNPAKRSCCGSGKKALPFTPSDQPGQQRQIPTRAQDNNQRPATDQAPVSQSSHAFTNGHTAMHNSIHPSMYSSLGALAMPPYSTMSNGTDGSTSMPYQQNAPIYGVTMVHPFDDGEAQSCTCGDDCACFACAMHPTNRTTLEYGTQTGLAINCKEK